MVVKVLHRSQPFSVCERDCQVQYGCFTFDKGKCTGVQTILSLFCFALLRKMEVVPSFLVCIHLVLPGAERLGRVDPVLQWKNVCSRSVVNKSFSQVQSHYLH